MNDACPAAGALPGPSPAHGSRPPAVRNATASTFGPSAVATPANGITVLRLVVTPVLVALIAVHKADWWTLVLWAVLSSTDGIDGWVARRQGATRSGAFLDPLADKVVVLGALVALVAVGVVWWVPVALIGVREVWMSLFRIVVGRRGISIPARKSAKVKTLLQDVAIGMCLAPPLVHHHGLLSGGIWVAAGLTVVTGAQYMADGRGSRMRAVAAHHHAALPGREDRRT